MGAGEHVAPERTEMDKARELYERIQEAVRRLSGVQGEVAMSFLMAPTQVRTGKLQNAQWDADSIATDLINQVGRLGKF